MITAIELLMISESSMSFDFKVMQLQSVSQDCCRLCDLGARNSHVVTAKKKQGHNPLGIPPE